VNMRIFQIEEQYNVFYRIDEDDMIRDKQEEMFTAVLRQKGVK
jgi:hypothetical protein